MGPIGDIDVLLDEADADRLSVTLGLPLQPGTAHPAFRSRRFARWTAPPLPVEFMAGFEHRGAPGWTPVRPRTRARIDHPAGPFFVPARHELIEMFRRFGRPKDLSRAAALERLDEGRGSGAGDRLRPAGDHRLLHVAVVEDDDRLAGRKTMRD